jgi:hypothetical protein
MASTIFSPCATDSSTGFPKTTRIASNAVVSNGSAQSA